MVKTSEETVIFNSSPLINLAKLNRLDLIDKMYGSIIIPQAVYDELVVNGKQRKGAKEIKTLVSQDIIDIKEVIDREIVKVINKDLDYGESEVIALALQLDSDLVIIDESEARDVADIYNLNKSGFIGILIKASNEGYINSVKKYLDLAIEKGFRISNNLYEMVLEQVNSE